MKKLLFTLVSIVLLCNIADAQSTGCNTTSLDDSTHVCSGDTTTMRISMSGTDSVLSITWSPAIGLSSTTILNPVVTGLPPGGLYRIVIQSVLPTNLVTNGDFTAGNTGFTSDYAYGTSATWCNTAGNYAVTTGPSLVATGAPPVFPDHTTGSGLMMVVNGATSGGQRVWEQAIASILPYNDYVFTVWVANWNAADAGAGAPNLQLGITGNATPYTPIGASTITAGVGAWTKVDYVWSSGPNIMCTLDIVDLNT